MKTSLTLLLAAFSLFLHAQDLNTDYTPIEFTGKIPDEFLKDMREITEEELSNRQGEGLTKKQGMDYYASSNYILRDLYLSGYVYFNDTLTQYVNTMAKEILKHLDAKDAAGLRFYVTKFSIPNALSWRNGTVLINIGLFDYVENEAQLALSLVTKLSITSSNIHLICMCGNESWKSEKAERNCRLLMQSRTRTSQKW